MTIYINNQFHYETENLVGHSVVIEDDVFRMDFDSTGKIIHIDSHGPVGG